MLLISQIHSLLHSLNPNESDYTIIKTSSFMKEIVAIKLVVMKCIVSKIEVNLIETRL